MKNTGWNEKFIKNLIYLLTQMRYAVCPFGSWTCVISSKLSKNIFEPSPIFPAT